jgi:hypothetical protein
LINFLLSKKIVLLAGKVKKMLENPKIELEI